MNLEDRIYGQALAMAGEVTRNQESLLRCLCRAAKGALESRLRSGYRPEDCREEFTTAGSLMAYAAFLESDSAPQRFTAGELTIQQADRSAAVCALRTQAEGLMAPYVHSGIFLGV